MAVNWPINTEKPYVSKQANAYAGFFTPTGGQLVVGTEAAINSRTGTAATGNTGSWKGTLALETTAPGIN